ncbi:ER membrane protein complex subunit 10 [Phlebotomus argentipes]|uniref:ER membrane protein complex subunit 10 n=1 Tax=Phlebotomus argentipes TaxID=94469 RepID=UPI00289345DB|nr:ER membrane protein complex subunit 10 [Phlebotomus argentipes]
MLRLIIAVGIFFLFCDAQDAFFDGRTTIELHHFLHESGPTFRGNISLSSDGHARISQEQLSEEDRLKLVDLARRDGFYRLRATVEGISGKPVELFTSTKACLLLKNFLLDNLWVSLDHLGSVIGIHQVVAGSQACAEGEQLTAEFAGEFTTGVFVKQSELAPIPDTASFIQKLEREREARERGEVKDNRGFFAKYWMYIVPVVILLLLSGATNPDAAAGGGGR